jgi:outer membrane protein TolC
MPFGLPSYRFWAGFAFHALVALLVLGCAGTDKNLTYIGDSEMTSYEGSATQIESPNEVDHAVDPIAGSTRPHTIRDRTKEDSVWDLSLVEAIHLALVNNRVARTRNEFLSPGNSILNNPEGLTTVYDPAIRESGVLFGTRGVESALSAFDTQWTTSMTWGRSLAIQNNTFLAGGLPEGGVLDQNTAAFTTGLTKNMAYGGSIGLSHNWNYLQSNPIFQLFPSVYTGNVLLNYTQPLWAGAGAEVNRIAGPIALNVPGVSGVNQGVMVARINTDVSLLEFEAQIRNMIKDVEDVYWDLYLAYRTYDSLVTARNSALATWRVVSAKARTGSAGGGAAAEAEALESYFDAQARVEAALGGPAARGASSAEPGLYGIELQLRRMLRLPANDGRIIRPSDEPAIADYVPNWHACLAEALTRREEVRRQKWNIKSTELQLAAARNLAHPQLNFVSSYQVNGFGNNLFGQDGPGTSRRSELQNAYRQLATAEQTGWTLGFQFNMPFGLRNALSQVRNYELRLTKAREVLAAQEVEISHELANAFQMLDYWYSAMRTGYNRMLAAEQRLRGVEAEYAADRKEIEFLLQAQTRYAAAEAAYFRSIVEYNKSVAEIHYRKGTLLENNNIHLTEGSWTPEAYKDAVRRAWARTFAFDAPFFDPVHSEPASIIGDASSDEPEHADPGTGAFDASIWDTDESSVTSASAEMPRNVKPGVGRPLPELPRRLQPSRVSTAPSLWERPRGDAAEWKRE